MGLSLPDARGSTRQRTGRCRRGPCSEGTFQIPSPSSQLYGQGILEPAGCADLTAQVARPMHGHRGRGRSAARLADAARLRVAAEHVGEGPLFWFGWRGGASGQGAPGQPPGGGGDTLLAGQAAAEGGPAGVLAICSQAGADDLPELVGADGEEQVAVRPPRLAVVAGPQAELGLERASDGCDLGERGGGAPQGVCVPVGRAAEQAVDIGRGGQRTVRRAASAAVTAIR